VRYLSSLDRIELVQMRTAGVWRRMRDTRYQHPAQIILPGQTFTQTFDCRVAEGYERHLCCDFRYLRMSGESVIRRLYARQTPAETNEDADVYSETYVRVDETKLTTIDPTPHHYILHRRRPSASETRLVSVRVKTKGVAPAATPSPSAPAPNDEPKAEQQEAPKPDGATPAPDDAPKPKPEQPQPQANVEGAAPPAPKAPPKADTPAGKTME